MPRKAVEEGTGSVVPSDLDGRGLEPLSMDRWQGWDYGYSKVGRSHRSAHSPVQASKSLGPSLLGEASGL